MGCSVSSSVYDNVMCTLVRIGVSPLLMYKGDLLLHPVGHFTGTNSL